MTTLSLPGGRAPDAFNQPLSSDRAAMAAILALLWVGVAGGFGLDAKDFLEQQPPAPFMVHVHAVAFVGWMALLTAQILFIRRGDVARHRRLGALGGLLAIAMLVLGPAAAILTDIQQFNIDHHPPRFIAVQIGSMLVFGPLVAIALAMRNQPAVHKRLMVLATISIANAGFSRMRGHLLNLHWPHEPLYNFIKLYGADWALILILAVYDLATRKRLHPAFIGGAALVAIYEVGASILMDSPAFNPIALALIGR